MLHTLLLNFTYECISFISERRTIKLVANDKVEVLSAWEEEIHWGSGKMYHPAVIRLKHNVRWIPRQVRFNRYNVFKRDQYICQYCGKLAGATKLSVDHIIPKDRGGENSWKNCVTACFNCNNRKGNRTPEEADLKLLRPPFTPQISLLNDISVLNNKHESWKDYLPIGSSNSQFHWD